MNVKSIVENNEKYEVELTVEALLAQLQDLHLGRRHGIQALLFDGVLNCLGIQRLDGILGDTAVIDFDGYKDGVPFEGGSAQGHALVLGSHSFIPGFEEQVVGMSGRSAASSWVARSIYCWSSASTASSVTVGRTLSASKPLYCFNVITGRTRRKRT